VTDGILVARVSLDMTGKYVDGLWTVIFTKSVMLCFTWLICVFGGLSNLLLYIELLGVVIRGW
jgi:hypothetical protein